MSWDGRGTTDLAQHHARVGARLQGEGDLEGALRHFNRAAEVQPDYPGLHRHRGWLHFLRGDFRQALLDLDAELESDPADPESYECRARVRLATEDYDGALRDYTWLVGRFPHDSRVHRLRGLGFAEAGNLDRALDDTGFAVEMDSRNVDALVSRGWVRMRRGEIDRAAEDAGRALSLDGGNAGAHQLQGRLRLAAGDLKEARDSFHVAVSKGWPELSVAVVTYLEGSSLDARELFEKSLATLWRNPDLRDYGFLYLWLCKRMLGREADADAWLARGMERPSRRRADWTGRIASFLVRSSSESELRSAAESRIPAVREEREAQVAFYAGVLRKLSGDAAGAAQAFRACVDSRQIATYEWVLARGELAAT